MDIKGKVAIVTGASRGIGLATARLLAAQGAKVALTARSKDLLDAAAQALPGALPVVADMTDETAVRQMVAAVAGRFGRVDILVNNAGRGYDAPTELIDTQTFREIFQLNVVGPLVAMQAVIPLMRRQGGGAIVNVSSGTALMYLPGMGPYSSSKRALNGITLTAREELAKDRIAVSVVYPYITATEFEAHTIKASAPDEQEEGHPGRPPADPPEFVARMIVDVIKSGAAEAYAHDWMKR